jgi:hypothetical protein
MGEWETYLAWNSAIADYVYTSDLAGQPAYLDLEEGTLDAIAELVEGAEGDAQQALLSTVRPTLDFGQGPAAVLKQHLTRVMSWWERQSIEAPPVLPLLASLSLAAENMQADEGFSANNFYGRYGDLMGLSQDETDEFVKAYRYSVSGNPASEWLWGALNLWLERLEGNRGLPTAFADSLAHVGLALSQAIVRETDRERLPELFSLYGLAPHGKLHSSEMADLMAEWMARVPCPVSNNLKRLWDSDEGARERIVDAACLALTFWDGSGGSVSTGSSSQRYGIGGVRVNLAVTSFPFSQVEIGLLLARSGGQGIEDFDVIDGEGKTVATIGLVVRGPGWMGLADQTEMDAASFLNAHARLESPELSVLSERQPRRVVPLRRDDRLMTYVEVERLGLGEDSVLLCALELASQVEEVLTAAARPGWSSTRELQGLPKGWALFQSVQILSSIQPELLSTRRVDLNVLQPMGRSLVSMEGGMRLPGNIQKFSRFQAPELRVASSQAMSIKATLRCTHSLADPSPQTQELIADQPVLVWSLGDLSLPDGDYEISVVEDEGGSVSRRALRLRSADSPAIHLANDDIVLLREPHDAWGVLSAEHDKQQRGFQTALAHSLSLEIEPLANTVPAWYRPGRERRGKPTANIVVSFPAPEVGSCILTGMHHMMLPTAMNGQASIDGVCKNCGLIKRYPTKAKYKRSRSPSLKSVKVAPMIDVRDIEKIEVARTIDWKTGFDALCHLGGGSVASLEQVAMQMEPSSVFTDRFIRSLESLGHIEVLRDRSRLKPSSWQVADPSFVGLCDGRSALTGYRSEKLMSALEETADAAGLMIDVVQNRDALARVRLAGGSTADLEVMASLLSDLLDRSIKVVPNAAMSLALSLPPLSSVLAELPITSAIGGRSVERWNTQAARFEDASDVSLAGAYRIRGFSRSYLFRRPEDVGEMTALQGDARIVKYAAALAADVPLLGYDESAEVLYSPLGAELPGLYGRAACLASGVTPRENLNDRLLEYHAVTPRLAGLLMNLVMN